MTKAIAKWSLIRPLVLTLVVLCLLSGARRAGDWSKTESQQSHHVVESAFSAIAKGPPARNFGDLKFSYGKLKRFRVSVAKDSVLGTERAVNAVATELKTKLALPFKIEVVFEHCGGPDSFYDDGTHNITICYELIDAYYELFSRTLKTRTARDTAAKGAVVSMFLHEVAHALIDGWELPITGREEDAADQFSTLLLINDLPDGKEMALDGALSFKLLADLEKDLDKDYSDPHSLDEQRFFNTICLLYGHQPKRFEYLVKNGTISTERAFECEADYARVSKSWQTLLAPHLIRPTAARLEF